MNKFTKITKTQFLQDMSESASILAAAGYHSYGLDDEDWENQVIEVCEDLTVNHDEVMECECDVHTTYIERIDSDGDKSYLYLNQSCRYEFFGYTNIRIVKMTYDSDNMRSKYIVYILI